MRVPSGWSHERLGGEREIVSHTAALESKAQCNMRREWKEHVFNRRRRHVLGLPRGAGVYGLHDRGGVREMGSVGLGWVTLSRSSLEGVCAANWIGSFRPWLRL